MSAHPPPQLDAARSALVLQSLDSVRSHALYLYRRRRICAAKRGLCRQDFVDEARLALCLAAATHDPDRTPWVPYCRCLVKRRISRLLSQTPDTSKGGRAIDTLVGPPEQTAPEHTFDELVQPVAPGDRELLRLAYVDDQSVREIGRATGLHYRTVHRRLVAAQARIRQSLARSA